MLKMHAKKESNKRSIGLGLSRRRGDRGRRRGAGGAAEPASLSVEEIEESVSFVEPPSQSGTICTVSLSESLAPALLAGGNGSTFKGRLKELATCLRVALNRRVAREYKGRGTARRLASKAREFDRETRSRHLTECFANFSLEAAEYEERVNSEGGGKRGSKGRGRKGIGRRIAVLRAVKPPRRGSITCTPEGYR